MRTVVIDAEIEDEVCIARLHGAGNEYLTEEYIPGTSVWGAFAAATGIVRPGDTPPDQFMQAFYSGDIVFTNLYPLDLNDRATPIPLSARTQKWGPGFLSDHPFFRYGETESECLHRAGIRDWLIDGPPLRFDPDSQPASGWYAGSPPNCRQVTTLLASRGHVDRSGRSGTASEGKLFTRQTWHADSDFAARYAP